MERYEVLLAGEIIGFIDAEMQGLYCHYQCRCILSGEVMYHLLLQWEDKTVDLGLLIPDGDGFGLKKKVATKLTGQGKPRIILKPRHEQMNGRFVPIRPEEPFAFLQALGECVLAVRGGEMGAVLPGEK